MCILSVCSCKFAFLRVSFLCIYYSWTPNSVTSRNIRLAYFNFLNPDFISLIYTNTLDHKIVRDFIGTYLIAAGLTSFLKTFLLNFWWRHSFFFVESCISMSVLWQEFLIEFALRKLICIQFNKNISISNWYSLYLCEIFLKINLNIY